MDSIYWVLSRDCNQRCTHCYNDTEPGALGLHVDDVDRCVGNLPDPEDVEVDRIILSGGEVLVWPELLFYALCRLRARFGVRTELWVQTNGDLLDSATLDHLLDHHVSRIDVSSMDAFHPKASVERRVPLTELFLSRGMVPAEAADASYDAARFGFWGASPDQWIGPLWPRGRARKKGLSAATPEHDFCGMWSGAKNFLNYREPGCEVNVQLSDVYPCCPMTCRPPRKPAERATDRDARPLRKAPGLPGSQRGSARGDGRIAGHQRSGGAPSQSRTGQSMPLV